MSQEQYTFKALNTENIHLLIPLYKKVFGVSYTLEQVKQKYQPDYTGIFAQGHFAFYKGKAVAFHGAIPMLMRYQNQTELCAQYGDAMTIKQHAGNGLFSRLGELTDEVLISKGVRFVWGFPNQNSEYPYVHKLHWKGEERMQCYILPLSTISSETIYRKTRLFEKQKQASIQKQLKPLLIEKKDLHSIDTTQFGGIDRSRAFYQYKSFSPNYFIRLNDTRIWIKPLGGLLVGDLEIRDEDQVFTCISKLKELARKLGLNKLVIQASPRSPLNQTLQKRYQASESWLIGYKNFNSNFPLNELQFTYGDLDTF
jgi:hypothetical protein